MTESKSIFKSQTVLGIAAMLISATIVPGIQAYEKNQSIEDVGKAVLPVLLATVLPSAIAVDGRIKADKKIEW